MLVERFSLVGWLLYCYGLWDAQPVFSIHWSIEVAPVAPKHLGFRWVNLIQCIFLNKTLYIVGLCNLDQKRHQSPVHKLCKYRVST